MNSSDSIALCALAISILTFVFTAYEQYFRRPQIRLALGDTIGLSQNKAGYLGIVVDLSLFNGGAREVQVVSLTGAMHSNASGREVSLRWFCFTDSRQVQLPDGRYSPWTAFSSWPATLLIPGRTGINRSVSLNTDAPVRINPGDYSITVVAWGARYQGGPMASIRFRVAVDADDEQALKRGATGEDGQGSIRHFKRWRSLDVDDDVYRSAPREIPPPLEL